MTTFPLDKFITDTQVSVQEQDKFFRLDDGSYVLDSGDVIPPEELEFYDDLGTNPARDWHAHDVDVQEQAYDQAIDVSPSEWTEFAVNIAVDGKARPFSFTGREYLKLPYDIQTMRVLLMCGRQVEKSTLLGNSILARLCIVPHFRALYVSPTHEQTKVFRRDRIGEPISLSEVLQAYISPKHANNMSIIKFVNFAQLTLRYAYLSADRVRGIPTDAVYLDEIQDILKDNIPVIEECASHGNKLLKQFVYSGTPKSYDNTIEHLFQKRSTQNEWAVPCSCKVTVAATGSIKQYWNVPLNESNIGLEGLICSNCGKRIDPSHKDATWASMQPSLRTHKTIEAFESFRIPQLMVPWINWKELLDKYENYARARFFNEVLAMSYDSGTRPLRQQDLMEASTPSMRFRGLPLYEIQQRVAGRPVFMGIDWGTGENTYTVVTLGTYLGSTGPNSNFTIFYFKRYTGVELDPEVQLEDIYRLVAIFKPMIIGTDYGGGFDRNKKLINKYGMQRVCKYQYAGGHGGGKRVKVLFDTKRGVYLLSRTEVMSDMFNAIREKVIRFPRWEDWQEPFGMDMLSIYSEYNETLRMIQYDKSINGTDDAFHSSLYCFFCSMIMYPRPDILRPTYQSGS